MEFFLPGFAALLIAALLVFLVLPRLGAPVLAVLALLLLGFGVYNHYQLFATEYRYSTWQSHLSTYAPFFMVGALILSILFYMGFLFGTKGPEALPASNLPVSTNAAVNAVVNNTAGAVVNVANQAVEAVNTVTNTIANTLGLNGNKGNRGNALRNLGGILATPAKNNRESF